MSNIISGNLGYKGEKGDKGTTIDSVTKTSSGLVDTYTVEYSDETEPTTITVTNGTDGVTPEILGYSQTAYNHAKSIYNNWDDTVTDYTEMFKNDTDLVLFPLVDTSNGINFSYMFYGCSRLASIPKLNMSNAMTCSHMFDGCQDIITIPRLGTSYCQNYSYMFSTCTALLTIPRLYTVDGTNFEQMFSYCRSLTTIPQLYTENGTNFEKMFYYCESLTTIPKLPTVKATNMTNMFGECPNLSKDSLNNILRMCISATSYTGTKTLAELGLTSSKYPSTLIQSLSSYSDFTTAGWTIGY